MSHLFPLCYGVWVCYECIAGIHLHPFGDGFVPDYAAESASHIVYSPRAVTNADAVKEQGDVADAVGAGHVHEPQWVLLCKQLWHQLPERENDEDSDQAALDDDVEANWVVSMARPAGKCGDLCEQEACEDCAELSANDESLDVIWAVDELVKPVGSRVDVFECLSVPVLRGHNRDHHALQIEEKSQDAEEDDVGSSWWSWQHIHSFPDPVQYEEDCTACGKGAPQILEIVKPRQGFSCFGVAKGNMICAPILCGGAGDRVFDAICADQLLVAASAEMVAAELASNMVQQPGKVADANPLGCQGKTDHKLAAVDVEEFQGVLLDVDLADELSEGECDRHPR